MGHRIVLATFGSLGDLHPYLAIALELKKRGHTPIIATIEMYRDAIESNGIEFSLLRSALVERPDGELMQKILDLRNGPEYIVRKLMMPALSTAYEDTKRALTNASLLVSHPMTYAARLAAESDGLPWVSTQLAPMGYFSAYDPPVLPIAPILERLRFLGPIFFKPFLALAKRSVRSWTTPYHQLRSDLSLPPAGDPMFDGGHSPSLELALFSRVLGEPKPDWPKQVVVTGFPFYDGRDATLAPALEQFLESGEPPIVFTLGTSAVLDAGKFYADSAQAAQILGMRAVLLVGRDTNNSLPLLPEGIISAPYAPFSLLFSRCAAVVHQGGVGTTAQAMRAGLPELVMPYAVDQPDNAWRVERLGVARIVPRKDYSSERAAFELNRLLTVPSYASRAKEISEALVAENGASTACDHLEAILR